MYEKAEELVIGSQRSNISYIQRELRIGYNRAAHLIEEMERRGVVGPLQADGTRPVLVSI
jgi:S-DNA-T family DNA segregation ATPase FtsK/SpoIIIE